MGVMATVNHNNREFAPTAHAPVIEILLMIAVALLGTAFAHSLLTEPQSANLLAVGGITIDAEATRMLAQFFTAALTYLPKNYSLTLLLVGVLVWSVSLRHGVWKKTCDLDQQRADLEAIIAARTAELQAAHAKVAAYNSNLERLVASRTAEVVAVQDTAVFALAKLADSRDPETGEHLLRIRAYSQLIAEELAQDSPYAEAIDQQFLDDLYRSSPLHDIGKVGVADAVLCKNGKLTPAEFEIMKQHTIIGANALDQVMFNSDHAGFLAMASVIARFHHERFDGTGYFAGLAGEKIPLPARIVAVADVYDALTSKRVYKDAYPAELARGMVIAESGKHFDPVVVDAFLCRFSEMQAARDDIREAVPSTVGATALLGDLLQTSLQLEEA